MLHFAAFLLATFVLSALVKRVMPQRGQRDGSWLSGGGGPWTTAARQLGLQLVPGGEGSLTSYPYRNTMSLSGAVDGCGVRVERLEREDRREGWIISRVLVRSPQAPFAGDGDVGRAFNSLRRHGAKAHGGGLLYEEHEEMNDAAVVDLVRQMVVLCSQRGRDQLERMVIAGRTTEPAAALEFLLALHPYAACGKAVAAVVASGDQEAACVALAAAVKARDAEVVERVAAMVEVAGATLGKAIAGALGAMPGANAEPILLRLLTHKSGDVRHAAADALGIVGGVSAVEPLLKSGGKHAEEAVKRIQSRLHAEAGRISEVTDAAEGRLSEAVPEGGLSVVRTRS